MFFLSHLTEGYTTPQQVLIEELQAETDCPWWHIVGCTPSMFESQNQLIIYARPNSRDFNKVQYSTFLSGILAEYFAPGYDRYFFSLRSKKAWPGWAGFDGKKLKEIRKRNNLSIEDYKGVLENNLVFYVPDLKLPWILRKLDTLLYSFRIHLPLAISDFREKLGKPNIQSRDFSIHRNGFISVLKGSVFITSSKKGKVTKELVRNSCSEIIKYVLFDARKSCSYLNIEKYLPVGYAKIGIFKKNYRKRKLKNYGLQSDLIGTVEIKTIHRIKSPDIYGATIETKGRFRIAWNQAWLKQVEIG